VVWKVGVGSMRNKAILVPAALAISAFAPMLIPPLLMAGGAYLCYEGFEKVAHRLLHSAAEDAAHQEELANALADSSVDMVALEQDKIRGAIRTDFILSAEIIVIALGIVSAAPFGQQVAVLAGVAVLMTIGVYGLVAAIVKLDDAGLYLTGTSTRAAQALGRLLLAAAPRLMKALGVIGTVAMFLVGGGIISHNVPQLHHFAETAVQAATQVAAIGPVLAALAPTAVDLGVGLVTGAVVLAAVTLVQRMRGKA